MTLRVAIAGAGYFAALHRDAWDRLPGAEVAAVADRDIGRARATGRPAFAGVAEMLAATPADLLDIALPPAAHAGAIRAGIAARVPAIVCQKPYCTSLAEARAVTAEAEAAGIPLIVHENFRFQPWFRTIRAALDTGRIGTPLSATIRLRPGDGQGPDAYRARQPYFREMPRFLIHETGIHYIDTFRYLFGEPVAVYADLRRLNPAIRGEDAGHLILSWTTGLAAVLDGNRLLDHATDDPRRTMGEALIEGTGGALALDGTGAVTLRPFGSRDTETLLPPDASGRFGGDCVRAFQAHVLAVLTEGAAPETPARGYLRNLGIEEAAYRSAAEGRRIALAP